MYSQKLIEQDAEEENHNKILLKCNWSNTFLKNYINLTH